MFVATVCVAAWALVQSADTLLVCSPEFAPAIEPWVAYRAAQGHAIARLAPIAPADALRARIRAVARREPRLRYLVLVGDAPPRPERPELLSTAQSPDAAAERLGPEAGFAVPAPPTGYVAARVVDRYGSEPDLATDNAYADLDDDGAPDLAVGRLAVTDAAELARLVARIRRYEAHTADPAACRIHLVAGHGGLGPAIDAAVESATRQLLTEHLPPTYELTVTSACRQSVYCPAPDRVRAATLARLNEGGLYWLYLGHGVPRALVGLDADDGGQAILTAADAAGLQTASRPPIALLLCCYAGAFDAPQGCVAEALLRADGGPIAVLAASRVTMPYGMARLATELARGHFADQLPTLGTLLLAAKRRLAGAADRPDEPSDPAAAAPREADTRRALDWLATALNPDGAPLADECREHVALFNLLGDPLLRLPYPLAAEVATSAETLAGGVCEVRGTSPLDGTAEIELLVRRDRLTFRPAARAAADDSPLAAARYQAEHARANDKRLAGTIVPVRQGAFAARLEVPIEARGACVVRVLVRPADGGAGRVALGATELLVRRPTAAAGPAALQAERPRAAAPPAAR